MLRQESVGNWATPVLQIMNQPKVLKKDVSLFSNSAWKSQQGAYSHYTMEKLQLTHPISENRVLN